MCYFHQNRTMTFLVFFFCFSSSLHRTSHFFFSFHTLHHVMLNNAGLLSLCIYLAHSSRWIAPLQKDFLCLHGTSFEICKGTESFTLMSSTIKVPCNRLEKKGPGRELSTSTTYCKKIWRLKWARCLLVLWFENCLKTFLTYKELTTSIRRTRKTL